MTTRTQRDKEKKQQDEFQAILRRLLLEEDNKYCADCDAKGPRWASWNIGVFLCIRCAGIHRNLGVHISKVKSVNLDTWTEKQIATINTLGNRCCREVYEANLPSSFRRPQTDSPLEHFIRAKYEHKKYTDKELEKKLQSRGPIIRSEPEKEKKKKASSQDKPATLQKLAKVPGPTAPNQSPAKARPAPIDGNAFQQTKAPAVVNSAPSTPPKTQSSMNDLLGLDTPNVNNTNDLLGLAVPQSGASLAPAPHLVASASAPSLTSLVPQSSSGGAPSNVDLFGPAETTAPTTGLSQTSKESILALFGSQPSTQHQQMYNVPGGLYIPSQQPNQPQPMMTQQQGYQQQGMMGMPQQQAMMSAGQQQQQGMMGIPAGQQQGMMAMPAGQQQGMMAMPAGQQQGMMGMPAGQQQGMMGVNMGYTGVNPMQQQQAYLQQVQAQMKNMRVTNPAGQMNGPVAGQQMNGPVAMNGQIPQQQQAWNGGMYPSMQQAQGVPVQGNPGWNGNMTGHTLSTQLWK